MSMQYVLLILVLVVNSDRFKFYAVTHSYSSHPFLCTLDMYYGPWYSAKDSSTYIQVLSNWANNSSPTHAGLPISRIQMTGCIHSIHATNILNSSVTMSMWVILVQCFITSRVGISAWNVRQVLFIASYFVAVNNHWTGLLEWPVIYAH